MMISVIVPIHIWYDEIKKIANLRINIGDFIDFILIVNGTSELARIVKDNIKQINKLGNFILASILSNKL